MELCQWCEQPKAIKVMESVYWELPDGTKAIEITGVPAFKCESCSGSAVYQSEEIIQEIDNQPFIIDMKEIEKSLTYEELMNKSKILKRTYFNF